MNVKEYMAKRAVEIAADDTNGYTGVYPKNQWWQDTKNNDCGSFMSLVLHLGLLKILIETGYNYFEPMGDKTPWNEAFLLKYCDRYNYSDIRNEVGDILTSNGHTVMITAVDPDYITHAANDYDGVSGDSSGREVRTERLYDGGWNYIYRLKDIYNKDIDAGTDVDTSEDEIMTKLETLRNGSTGNQVKNLQALLNLWTTQSGDYEPIAVDGYFGDETENRLKVYQTLQGLYVDGVCGQITWADILLS